MDKSFFIKLWRIMDLKKILDKLSKHEKKMENLQKMIELLKRKEKIKAIRSMREFDKNTHKFYYF